MITWEQVHAGDIVVGHDDLLYGVACVAPGPVVTLRRNGVLITAQPPPGTPIELWAAADQSAEERAWNVLRGAGLAPEVIGEWNG